MAGYWGKADMKKRVLLKVGLVFVLGLGGCVSYQWWAWWTGPRNKINQETVAQIRIGMKLEDVERIIDGPPGYYTRPAIIETAYPFSFGNAEYLWWVTDNGRIEVRFNDGVVTEAAYASLPYPKRKHIVGHAAPSR
jgi:hypothetical protein